MSKIILSNYKCSRLFTRHKWHNTFFSTSKSEYIYDKIFSDIKNILIENNISTKNIPNKVMVNFEKSLINTLNKNFPETIINGCFFHYIKLIWKKAKSLSLCNKDKLKNTKLLIFIFKLLSFLLQDNKEELFDKLEDHYTQNNSNYKKFINYYKNNWLNNKYIN